MDDRRTPPAHRSLQRRMIASVMALLMTGCAGLPATTHPEQAEPGSRRPDNTVADWPLKFVQHNFGATSYSTYGCTVIYNGFRHLSEPDDQLQMSSHDAHPDSLKSANAGYLGILEFPPPAKVRWRSRDGVQHEVEVDIGAIFKDRLILHKVPRQDIPEGVSILNPDIVLEVNDRTINVYMRAFIPTKSLRTPGNPHSNYRRDLILAWSRTY